MNTVVPLHYIENQNGSALWNNTPGSDVLDYMTAQDMKQADIRAKQVTPISNNICQLHVVHISIWNLFNMSSVKCLIGFYI
jgi:hypothetical protein